MARDPNQAGRLGNIRPAAYVAAGALGITAIGHVLPGIHLFPNINFGNLFGHDQTQVEALDTELDSLYAPKQIPLLIASGKGSGYVDSRPHSSFGPLDWLYKETDNHHSAKTVKADIQIWLARKSLKVSAYKLPSGTGSTQSNQTVGLNVLVNPRGLWTETAKEGTDIGADGRPKADSGESAVVGIWDGLTNANNAPYDVAAETVALSAFDHNCGMALTVVLPAAIKQWERTDLTSNANILDKTGNHSAADRERQLAGGPINVTFLPLHKKQSRTSNPFQLVDYMPKNFVAPEPTGALIAPILGEAAKSSNVSLTKSQTCLNAQVAIRQEERMIQQSAPAAGTGGDHVGNL